MLPPPPRSGSSLPPLPPFLASLPPSPESAESFLWNLAFPSERDEGKKLRVPTLLLPLPSSLSLAKLWPRRPHNSRVFGPGRRPLCCSGGREQKSFFEVRFRFPLFFLRAPWRVECRVCRLAIPVSFSFSLSATMTTGNGGGGGGAKQGGRGEVSWREKKSCNLIAHTHSTTDGNGKQKKIGVALLHSANEAFVCSMLYLMRAPPALPSRSLFRNTKSPSCLHTRTLLMQSQRGKVDPLALS